MGLYEFTMTKHHCVYTHWHLGECIFIFSKSIGLNVLSQHFVVINILFYLVAPTDERQESIITILNTI